jgi:hypothetical protein
LNAFSAKHEEQRAGFYGLLDVKAQLVQSGNNLGGISRARMFVVLREEPRHTISIINNFVSNTLEFFNETGGTEGRRSFLESGLESSRARRRAN